MSFSLQKIIPIFPFQSTRRTYQNRVSQFQFLCSSAKSNIQEGQEKRAESEGRVILVERYSNGAAKRYIQDDGLFFRTILEEDVSLNNNRRGLHLSDAKLSWLPSVVKDFILPAGFPGTAAAASAAAIRWVSKDGIGAVGRLFIGGWFGNLFDDDPKQWRMYADFIGSAGSIFDLSTQVYPAYFLLLASVGNLAKAVARGLKDPSFRVIQNHFAISGNLGEVAAKEEVWEVAAQLLGLALGVLILDSPGLVKHFPTLASTWAGMRLFHLWLRYQSLSVLQFNTINLKRARMLVSSHVLTTTVPGFVDCNREENILLWERFMKPQITFGVALDDMIGGGRSVSKLQALIKIYQKEKYILLMKRHQDVEVFVSFKVGATSLTVLQSLWQTYWLHENPNMSDDIFDQLAQSLLEMNGKFEGFLRQLGEAGWDTCQINLKVPKGVSIDEHPV